MYHKRLLACLLQPLGGKFTANVPSCYSHVDATALNLFPCCLPLSWCTYTAQA